MFNIFIWFIMASSFTKIIWWHQIDRYVQHHSKSFKIKLSFCIEFVLNRLYLPTNPRSNYLISIRHIKIELTLNFSVWKPNAPPKNLWNGVHKTAYVICMMISPAKCTVASSIEFTTATCKGLAHGMPQVINRTNDALLPKTRENIKCDPLLENIHFDYCKNENVPCDHRLVAPLLGCTENITSTST